MINILIADDHTLMRAGTSHSLHKFLAGAQITEVDNFKKALFAAESTAFDLVIMDIGMPGGNSVKMIEKFMQKSPSTPILVYSSYDEKLYALAFIKAGAMGYLSKEATESEFKNAVEGIIFQKRIYVSENIREESFRMFMKTGKGVEDSTPLLSVREREIAQMFISGKGVSEIAAILDLHTSTVSTHRMRILKKMGVDNLMDLSRKMNMLF